MEPKRKLLMNDQKTNRPVVIPSLRYQDAPKAIEWLCDTFGFEKNLVVPGEGGRIAHAQLTFGNGMIMLGSVDAGEYGRHLKQPAETGGAVTQSIYIIVPDTDAHYSRARAAGATIVIDIKDEDYGGRGYTCRDLEGHIWSFGSYNPWND
jgi:uncharacterized glyoxalase superfamily protein PhnB